jgi:hypothetical protein
MSKLKVDQLEEVTGGANVTINTGSDLIVDDNIQLGHDSDTTLARASAGDISVEGNTVYRAGGTDVSVADGGTGASDASTARTNLGVAIGSDVQAYDAQLASVAAWTAAQVTTLGTIGTVTTGANQIIVTSGADTFAAQSCTAAGLALLDDADASAQRTTLVMGMFLQLMT